jgi:hypothetical protein
MNRNKLKCHACGYSGLQSILNLGSTTLADLLLTEERLSQPEETFPLEVVFCANCTLVQITETVDPEILYGEDYPYFSSVSKTLLEHFRGSARELIKSRKLNSNSLVVEAACSEEGREIYHSHPKTYDCLVLLDAFQHRDPFKSMILV